ncbi:MAG TPA: ATP-binding cassette domain-containing protein [Saprospiraceae bacterium]|nr:ATP-binding cassette domain-containing protein [Saprospiraceae bacterium]
MIKVNIQKRLNGANGLLDLNVKLSGVRGQMIGIMGKSGEGKSSLLRMLAGLLTPDSGEIQFDNELWFSSEMNVSKSPRYRQVGIVFQEYALFPNFTVLGNLLFAAGKKGRQEAEELLKRLELTELADKKPQSLSGGQQQRVALARALMYRPQLLLLDEAMAAVDEAMREKVQDLVLEYHRQYQPVGILVSHRYSELEKMADQIYELVDGQLKEVESSSSKGLTLMFSGIRGDKAQLVDSLGQVTEIPLDWVEGKIPGDRIYLNFGKLN